MNVLVSQMLTMTLLVVTMVVCLVHPTSGRGVGGDSQHIFPKIMKTDTRL